MTEIFSLLTGNISGILTVLAAAHGLAVAITNLTPTPKDDAAIAKVYKVVEWCAGIFTSKVKS